MATLLMLSYRGIIHCYSSGRICVKCNQSGKAFTVKVNVLSREDLEPLTENDLVKGSQLLMDKSYPVTVEKVILPEEKRGNLSEEKTMVINNTCLQTTSVHALLTVNLTYEGGLDYNYDGVLYTSLTYHL